MSIVKHKSMSLYVSLCPLPSTPKRNADTTRNAFKCEHGENFSDGEPSDVPQLVLLQSDMCAHPRVSLFCTSNVLFRTPAARYGSHVPSFQLLPALSMIRR